MSTAVPTLGLIGGTGLNELAETVSELEIETPYGSPSAAIQVIQETPARLLFLPRHGTPHRIPPHRVNYRANLWALREAGACQVLAIQAVGGICEPYSPGTLVVPDQVIDYTSGREHTVSDSADAPLVHVDFSWPYEGPLRNALLKAAAECDIAMVDGGCVGVFQGPRLESAAEVEMAKRAGCHMAGMTSMPEAGLARELGLDYAGIAVISNWGAGVAGRHLSEDDIAETLRAPMHKVRDLIKHLLLKL